MSYETFYNWILFPSLIFISRTCDVSLGTLRSVLAAKGKKKIVPFIGFFEVLLWLVAISSILKNLNNIMCYLGWAGGFAMGIYIGLAIEEKLALGTHVIRIISSSGQVQALTQAMADSGFGFTKFDGEGSRGPVKMLFTVVDRKRSREVIQLVEKHLPDAFYSIEEVRSAAKREYAVNVQRSNWKGWLLPLR